MTLTVSLSSDENDIELRIHPVRLTPAPGAREFARIADGSTAILQSQRSAKRERECLHAWIQEFNLECSIFHWPLLPDELIKPVPLHRSGTVVVGIDAVIVTWRRAVQFHGEADWFAILGGSQDEVKVARMKAENNPAGDRLQHCAFRTDLPTPAESPLIERHSGLWRVGTLRILSDRFGGSEMFCPMVADVGFR
jgi:hypothetical protein